MRNYELKNIPPELQELNQWVLWKYEVRDGKKTKVPYQGNGRKASADDPSTWTTFGKVLSDYLKYDGIGLMFGDVLAGVDLDDHHHDGIPSEFAEPIINDLNSYTEISPSGNGVHILCWGKLPEGRRKDQALGIEMYDQGRYFTITGWHLEGTPKTVENRDQELAKLHALIFGTKPEKTIQTTEGSGNSPTLDDQVILEKARAAANGAKFTDLYEGKIGEYPSQSEADLALCSNLAFWTGNQAAQIDRLFRTSGLMRPKWYETHSSSGSTYGQMTIERAIAMTTETYTPKLDGKQPPQPEPSFEDNEPEKNGYKDPWQVFTLADAYQERPPVEYVARGVFELPSLNILYGPPGTLKSFLLADLAVCVAAGLDWLPPAPWRADAEPFPTTQKTVMWLDFDNGKRRTHERFEALGRGRGLPPDIPLFYYSMPDPWLSASDKGSIGALILRAKNLDAKFICVDNLGAVTGGADENSNQMVAVMSLFRQLAEETGAANTLIHHQRKSTGNISRAGENLRGHSSIEAALDLALIVEREENSDIVNLKSTKTRGLDVLPFSAAFTYEHKPNGDLAEVKFYGLAIEDTSSDRAIERAIIDSLNGVTLNKTELTEAIKEDLPNMGTNRIRDRIDRLAAAGKIKENRGERNAKLYSLT